jgi:uncharacterized protein (TIGR03437 family)
MPAGNYSGNISLTVQISGGGTQSANLPVTLTITGGTSGGPSLTFDRPSIALAATAGGTPVSQNVVLSTSTPASFSASASSAGGWLSVAPNSGMTSPTATLAITANPAYLSAGTYTGMVTATSGTSSQALGVSLTVTARPPLVLAADHTSVSFACEQGAPMPLAQLIQLTSTGGPAAFSVSVDSSWLKVVSSSTSTPAALNVSFDPSGLVPGAYSSSISITSPNATNALRIAASLTITPLAAVQVSTNSLSFSYQPGAASPPSQSVAVTNTGDPLTFATTIAGGNWLSLSPTSGITPQSLTVAVQPQNLGPGTYTGAITITAGLVPTKPQTMSVTLQVSPPTPQITRVVNAASNATTPVAPGLILNIMGSGLGPTELVRAQPEGNKFGASLASVQVAMNGVAAPLLYVRSDVIGAIAPYGIAASQNVTIQVQYFGEKSNAITLPVAGSAPALFTSDQSGTGQGAILNQNSTLNTPQSAAAVESVVVLFLTGDGMESPLVGDGAIIQTPPYSKPLLPVTAKVGGVAVPTENILYAGAVPDSVEGLVQINLKLPLGITGQVPVMVSIGDAASQQGVTVSVH